MEKMSSFQYVMSLIREMELNYLRYERQEPP